MEKTKVCLIFGGRSAEHEISLRSAQNVIDAIDKESYDLKFIAIDRMGRWFSRRGASYRDLKMPLSIDQFTDPVAVDFGSPYKLFLPEAGNEPFPVDVFFPILHGPYGEDGTIQGMFRIMDKAFVGSDVLGSAAGMDKDVMKRLLRDAGLPIGKYIAGIRGEMPTFAEAISVLGRPLFVKPANMGSSVGISKVSTETAYLEALELAFRYDTKVLLEQNIEGLELECAVLGNEKPEASEVGRIITHDEFYSYSSKYLDEKATELEIPARISKKDREQVRDISIKVFRALEAFGLGRVDVFLTKDGRVIVNEINTMPGFTSISMYPMLWKECGLAYPDLITRLIELATERHAAREQLDCNL